MNGAGPSHPPTVRASSRPRALSTTAPKPAAATTGGFDDEPRFDLTSPYNPALGGLVRNGFQGVGLPRPSPSSGSSIRSSSVPRGAPREQQQHVPASSPQQPPFPPQRSPQHHPPSPMKPHPSPMQQPYFSNASPVMDYTIHASSQRRDPYGSPASSATPARSSFSPAMSPMPSPGHAPAATAIGYRAVNTPAASPSDQQPPFHGYAAVGTPIVMGTNAARFYHRAQPNIHTHGPDMSDSTSSSRPEEYATGFDALAALQLTRARYRAQQLAAQQQAGLERG